MNYNDSWILEAEVNTLRSDNQRLKSQVVRGTAFVPKKMEDVAAGSQRTLPAKESVTTREAGVSQK